LKLGGERQVAISQRQGDHRPSRLARIVLVKGMPSSWEQAAKTIFEIKGLDYVAAPWLSGEPNDDIVDRGGEASAPIVAWAGEKPIHRWIDIL